MNKFLCSLACTWMTIIGSQFYIIDSLSLDVSLDEMLTWWLACCTLLFFSGSFDNLMIETGDGTFPLNQLAQIVQKNPSLLVINLATMPQVIPSFKPFDSVFKDGTHLDILQRM